MNYVAVSKALNISSSVLAAGLAADNVICALYFSSLFALAAKIPPETSIATNGTLGFFFSSVLHSSSSYLNICVFQFLLVLDGSPDGTE